mgnify:CR=1 FL=1|jgi:hypothetical protein
MSLSLEDLLQHYPFLSFIKYTHSEYVGVIQNHDGDIVSIYAFNKLKSEDHKRRFLEQADLWWWESNRMIPINIFLKNAWNDFRYSLITLTVKDIKEQKGHIVSLNSLANKRTKRRVIQLVRKLS